MKAYAVFDGGGVKGAALAGALKAAQTNGIEFVGYGGSSAGSIVALLATVGYTGDELEGVMTEELSLASVASEIKGPLAGLKALQQDLSHPSLAALWRLRAHKTLIGRLSERLGFSDGQAFTERLFAVVKRKAKSLSQHFTFQELAALGMPALKIVASDLGMRRPVVFSNCGGDELNEPVLDAVRASMSYPFAFQPLRVGNRLLVDGGLSSNLPVFLFQRERESDRLPLMAFDLVTGAAFDEGKYDLAKYATRMLETALEAGDYLMREVLCDIHHVAISIPAEVHALDLDLPKAQLQGLFLRGYEATNEYIQWELETWPQAATEIESLQAQHASPDDVQFLLCQFAQHLERDAGLTSVRSNVMLPTSHGTRVVAYHFRMGSDADQDLELDVDAGCSGKCWTTQRPAYADLEDAATGDNFLKWKMTEAQQAKVRHARKTMVSIPIFAPGSDDQLIAVLSADSDTSIAGDGQPDEQALRKIVEIGKKWAVILTAVLG